jgi:phosphoribosylformylglycinamidine synthase I
MSSAGGTAPPIAVLHAPGTNRDGEAARAVELAGGRPEIVAVGDALEHFSGVILPGGFSYGDALGAGVRLALELSEVLVGFAGSGRPVLGICNGFQALVKAGLLTAAPAPGAARPVTLTHNGNGRFECRWVHLAPVEGAAAGIACALPALIACPIAHGEGRIAVTSGGVLDELAADGQVLFRYVDAAGRPADGRYPANPNDSAGDIAGLCNPAGNVWGLMPHPEDHVDAAQDPFGVSGRSGLPLFRSLVDRARAH